MSGGRFALVFTALRTRSALKDRLPIRYQQIGRQGSGSRLRRSLFSHLCEQAKSEYTTCRLGTQKRRFVKKEIAHAQAHLISNGAAAHHDSGIFQTPLNQQLIFQDRVGTGSGDFNGSTTPFGFWDLVSAGSSNAYGNDCAGAVYFYRLALLWSDGHVVLSTVGGCTCVHVTVSSVLTLRRFLIASSASVHSQSGASTRSR